MKEDIDITKLLEDFSKLNIPDGQYLIYGSAPLGVRGIRKIHDLDVVVADRLYQKLLQKYPETKDEKKRHIKLGDIELIPVSSSLIKNFQEAHSRADKIRGHKFVCLDDLAAWKKKMGRPKDFRDIRLIEKYQKTR